MECCYNYLLQNLYQYAFAFSNIEGRFLIYMMSPRALFNPDKPLSEDSNLENNEAVNICSMPMQENNAALMGSNELEEV